MVQLDYCISIVLRGNMKNCIKLSVFVLSLLFISGIATQNNITEQVVMNELPENIQEKEERAYSFVNYDDLIKFITEKKVQMQPWLDTIEEKIEKQCQMLDFTCNEINEVIYTVVGTYANACKEKFKQGMNLKIDDKENVVPVICS